MSNLFVLDDSDGNEDWDQNLGKEHVSQVNQEENEQVKEEQPQADPKIQTEEAKSENRFEKYLDGVEGVDTDITNDISDVLQDISGEMQSVKQMESKTEKESEPEPEYISQELPTDSDALNALLQKELARPKPNIPFVRRLLKQNHYSIPKELRCRTYSLLLYVDSSLVSNLADSVWPSIEMNVGIIEDYIHHIFPRFGSSSSNEETVIENTIWIFRGILSTTGVSYNHILTELALLLMCRLNMNREFTFLFMLNMFSTDFLSRPEPSPKRDKLKSSVLPSALLIDPQSDPVLTDTRDITHQVRLPVLSLSRGNAAMKYHCLFHLLCTFHLPALCSHLDKISPSWWTPFSYPIETQEDFVTVGY